MSNVLHTLRKWELPFQRFSSKQIPSTGKLCIYNKVDGWIVAHAFLCCVPWKWLSAPRYMAVLAKVWPTVGGSVPRTSWTPVHAVRYTSRLYNSGGDGGVPEHPILCIITRGMSVDASVLSEFIIQRYSWQSIQLATLLSWCDFRLNGNRTPIPSQWWGEGTTQMHGGGGICA